jgi:hypothetical protein
MKLQNLNGAIRKAKEVRIWLQVPNTPKPLLYVVVQKQSLLQVLGVAYGGDRSAETGLYIREEDGLLMTDVAGFAPPNPDFDGEWKEQYKALEGEINAYDPVDLLGDDEDLLGGAPPEAEDEDLLGGTTFTAEEADDVEDLLS